MECVEYALDMFKRLFGAEAVVEVEARGPDVAVARFSGNMCYTCGTYDYFEDFAYALSDCAGEEWGVEEYEQLPDGDYRVVFKPRRLMTKKTRHVKIVLGDEAFDLYLSQ
ncbi:MAG: hypothetical protein ABWK05_05900 [Pyrobaculum sp.]